MNFFGLPTAVTALGIDKQSLTILPVEQPVAHSPVSAYEVDVNVGDGIATFARLVAEADDGTFIRDKVLKAYQYIFVLKHYFRGADIMRPERMRLHKIEARRLALSLDSLATVFAIREKTKIVVYEKCLKKLNTSDDS
jgi:hypothetical protein